MNSVSITQLKINPTQAIKASFDFPLAVENRNKVEAYLIGKDLYELIVSRIEDLVDHNAIKATKFNSGRNFEDVAEELNI